MHFQFQLVQRITNFSTKTSSYSYQIKQFERHPEPRPLKKIILANIMSVLLNLGEAKKSDEGRGNRIRL